MRYFLLLSRYLADLRWYRYVPDETSFEDDPVHDEATEASIAAEGNSYQGLDFQTDALRHSKVKLTWDADDPHRKTKIQTYLAGVLDKSKQKGATKGRPKITEDDVAQYLASSSDEDDDDAEAEQEEDDFFEAAEPAEGAGDKGTKKLSKRDRLRGLLGLTSGSGTAGGDGEMEMTWDGEAAGGKKAKKAGAEGDMQITFAPALSERSAKQLDFAGDEHPETSIERYKRKEKERKERKKLERKARLEGRLDENGEPLTPSADVLAAQGDDAGFDDDFFADDGGDPFAAFDNGGADSGDEIGLPKKGKKDAAKLSKQERRAQREAEEKAAAEEQAKLGLLIGSDDEEDIFGADGAGEGGRHFDMRAVLKAEKNQGKKRKLKGKKAKAAQEQEVVQDNFKIDTTDDRFKSLHNDFDYAIDPSNPRCVPIALGPWRSGPVVDAILTFPFSTPATATKSRATWRLSSPKVASVAPRKPTSSASLSRRPKTGRRGSARCLRTRATRSTSSSRRSSARRATQADGASGPR